MNVRFHNTLRCELPVSIHKYKTVKVVKAIIPTTYYNVSRHFHNNYLRYAIIENDKIESQDSLTVPNGLYTPQTYNEAIQKSLKEKGLDSAIDIIYLKDQGRIQIKLNNENFAPVFH